MLPVFVLTYKQSDDSECKSRPCHRDITHQNKGCHCIMVSSTELWRRVSPVELLLWRTFPLLEQQVSGRCCSGPGLEPGLGPKPAEEPTPTGPIPCAPAPFLQGSEERLLALKSYQCFITPTQPWVRNSQRPFLNYVVVSHVSCNFPPIHWWDQCLNLRLFCEVWPNN